MEELLYFRNRGQTLFEEHKFLSCKKPHYFYPWMGEVQNKEDKFLPTRDNSVLNAFTGFECACVCRYAHLIEMRRRI